MFPAQNAGNLHRRVYGAYGEATASALARSSYAGEIEEQGPGWYLLGGRPYDPVRRRFLAPDTKSPFDEGGYSRYAYCSGDPVNRIDPTGESLWQWLGAAAGLAVAAIGTVMSAGAMASAFVPAAMAFKTAGMVTGTQAALATIATPAIAATTIAVTGDVVGIVAQVGSLVAAETRNHKAGEIMGWVQYGAMIIGTVGMGASFAAGAKPGPGGVSMPRQRTARTTTSSSAEATTGAGSAHVTSPGTPGGRLDGASTASSLVVTRRGENVTQPDLARLARKAAKEGIKEVTVLNGADADRRMPSRTGDGGDRAPRRSHDTERLASSTGVTVTENDMREAPPGKLRMVRAWQGDYVTPLLLTADRQTMNALNVRQVALHAGTRGAM